jgi:hypothetical protein
VVPTPPKVDPVRGHRGRGPTKLPAGGREGPAPEWPLPDGASPEEWEAWTELWRTPQAVAWERLGWTRTVARYCRLMVVAEQNVQPALQAQVTALEDRLGLTPKSLRLLLWEIAPDEVAEKRETRGARDRIKAV